MSHFVVKMHCQALEPYMLWHWHKLWSFADLPITPGHHPWHYLSPGVSMTLRTWRASCIAEGTEPLSLAFIPLSIDSTASQAKCWEKVSEHCTCSKACKQCDSLQGWSWAWLLQYMLTTVVSFVTLAFNNKQFEKQDNQDNATVGPHSISFFGFVLACPFKMNSEWFTCKVKINKACICVCGYWSSNMTRRRSRWM